MRILLVTNRFYIKQECIPVGCLPPASMIISTWGCLCPGGVSREGGCTPPAQLHAGIHIPYPIAYWDTPPPVGRMNDTRLWKHYLPATIVALINKLTEFWLLKLALNLLILSFLVRYYWCYAKCFDNNFWPQPSDVELVMRKYKISSSNVIVSFHGGNVFKNLRNGKTRHKFQDMISLDVVMGPSNETHY